MPRAYCLLSLYIQFVCAVRIHAYPFALLVEVSKLAWHFLNKSAEEVDECSAADSCCRVMNVGISSRLE